MADIRYTMFLLKSITTHNFSATLTVSFCTKKINEMNTFLEKEK